MLAQGLLDGAAKSNAVVVPDVEDPAVGAQIRQRIQVGNKTLLARERERRIGYRLVIGGSRVRPGSIHAAISHLDVLRALDAQLVVGTRNPRQLRESGQILVQ